LTKLRYVRQNRKLPADANSGCVDTVHHTLTESLHEIRNISSELALPQLDCLTLQQSLQKAAQAHSLRTGVNVDTRFRQLPDDVPQFVQICLFRFAQETLFNTYHHGGTSHARLSAEHRNGMLEVVITDDDIGFEIDITLGSHLGLGLSGLRQRIESAGGFFTINTRNGKGTQIIAQFILTTDSAINAL